MNSIKHKKLMVLMTNKGINSSEDRHELINAWTSGRTQSSKELTESELRDLIWKLENDQAFAANKQVTINALNEISLKEKRSIVLAIAQRTGIHEGTSFTAFNRWMQNSSILKKRLNKYNLDELDQLINQMRALEANYNASAETPGTKAWHHKNKIPYTNDN